MASSELIEALQALAHERKIDEFYLGFGMSRLVKENCDFLVKIPMKGKITSLIASVSAGIVIYEALKQKSLTGL